MSEKNGGEPEPAPCNPILPMLLVPSLAIPHRETIAAGPPAGTGGSHVRALSLEVAVDRDSAGDHEPGQHGRDLRARHPGDRLGDPRPQPCRGCRSPNAQRPFCFAVLLLTLSGYLVANDGRTMPPPAEPPTERLGVPFAVSPHLPRHRPSSPADGRRPSPR